MDYLEKNIDWLEEKLKPLLKGYYIILFYFVDLHPKSFLNTLTNYYYSYLAKLLKCSDNIIHVSDHYLLFDFPGQVELFFLHSNAKNVITKLIKKLNLQV